MKNTTILILIAVMVITAGVFVFANGGESSNVEVNPGQVVAGDVQRVVLSQNGYNYADAVAQAGKPIAISADNSVGGCLRAVVFNVEGKKYSKYLKTSDDLLELPALSKGTYTFSCTMGMGFGKLIVR